MPEATAGSIEDKKKEESAQSSKAETPQSSKRKEESAWSSKKEAKKTIGGPGSASGSASFATPKKEGMVSADMEEDADVNDADGDAPEEEDGAEEDDELAELEAMEAEGAEDKTPNSAKKRGRPKGSTAAKKKAKK